MANEALTDGTSDPEAAVEALPASVDRSAVGRIRFVATMLDERVRVPGTPVRIGIDPLLGIVPVAGDVLAGLLSLYVVAEAVRLGVSTATLARMLANVAVDVAGGSIPVVGDLFDVAWKANARNADLVVADLAAEGEVDVEAS
jgi:hypothetical protein